MALLKNSINAWNVLLGKAVAVKTPKDIIKRAHEFGMHGKNHYINEECIDCFNQSVNQYINYCSKMLVEIGKESQVIEFDNFIRRMTDDNGFNWLMLHTHPIYMICDFLGVGYENTPESEALQTIYARHTEDGPWSGSERQSL
jgi:hypothetical protein